MADSAADIESHTGQQKNAGLQTAKDLFSGAVGGIAQVLIGKYPSSPSHDPSPILILLQQANRST